jgi:glutathione S-transferase
MKFFNSIGPNPHTVRMFAAEKGVALDIQEVDVFNTEHRRPPYSERNPMMQTPMLETDDGHFITEITAICEYLEELFPEPRLVGATPWERAETRMWIRRIDLNIVEGRSRAFRATGGRAFYHDKIKLLSEPAAEELKLLVEDRIHWLDGELGSKPYICGDRYSLADIMFYCFMTFGAPAGGSNLPEGCPNLTAWHARIAARPSAKA